MKELNLQLLWSIFLTLFLLHFIEFCINPISKWILKNLGQEHDNTYTLIFSLFLFLTFEFLFYIAGDFKRLSVIIFTILYSITILFKLSKLMNSLHGQN